MQNKKQYLEKKVYLFLPKQLESFVWGMSERHWGSQARMGVPARRQARRPQCCRPPRAARRSHQKGGGQSASPAGTATQGRAGAVSHGLGLSWSLSAPPALEFMTAFTEGALTPRKGAHTKPIKLVMGILRIGLSILLFET